MTKAPFWTVAELVAQTAAPSGFQVSLEDIVPGVGTLVLGRLSRYSADGTPFERGDVLFGKLRPYLAKYWLADREGVAGGDIHVYRPRKGVDPRYLAYIVGSRDFMRYAVAASKGVKMPRVEWMSLRQYGVNWYDEDTQRRVADYLDRETGEIDAMLAKLDELREQLIQRRLAAVDNEFSCVGTSSKARLPFVADVIPGLTYSPSDIVDSGGVVVHRAGSVQNSRIDRSDLVRVSTSIPAKLCIQPGDILVCTRNGSAHLVGKCAIVGG